MVLTIIIQTLSPLHTHPGLEAVLRVVDPGVDNFAVPAAGDAANGWF